MARRIGAVIVAAGSGSRMGGVRKQYLEVGGEPVLLRAVRSFVEHGEVGEVVVVLPPEDVHAPPLWLRGLPVTPVPGGAERADSVWNGVQALPLDTEIVLVHDGARPFVSPALIDRVIAGGGVHGTVPAVRVSDTVKEASEDGFVLRTVDRARLWRAQTPQAFPYQGLLEAYLARDPSAPATDDAALCERAGMRVEIVDGDEFNLKITTAADLLFAEAIAARLRDA